MITITFQTLYCIYESFRDNAVIRWWSRSFGSSSQTRAGREKYNRQWHKLNAVAATSIHLLAAVYMESIWYLAFGLALRALTNQVLLNKLLGKPLNYLGNNGQDGWFKRNLGERNTLVFKIILLIAICEILNKV
jgi:hypothetical protein